MLIDCETCLARDIACHDCVVNVIFHEGLLDLSQDEAEAISHLAEAGLIPRLRLVEAEEKATVLPWKDSAAG
ncbi:MAG TPA: hypothetical protein VM470_07145 [Acidimicrobiia bacterium]|nr:hypothetical protein [Acidimicrobiia bacterium]